MDFKLELVPVLCVPRIPSTALTSRVGLPSGLVVMITGHVPSDPNARFLDLGPGYYAARTAPNAASATTSASSKPRAIICARARRT